MTTPIIYRVQSLYPANVTGAAELQAEQSESVPYPQGVPTAVSGDNWPPAGFTGVMTNMATAINKSSQLPDPWDLEWVQGDSTSFPFVFTDVMWLPDDPGVDDPFYYNDGLSVTTKALTSDVATLTLSAPHIYKVGYRILVADVGAPFDGVHTITEVTGSTISYACIGTNVAPVGEVGTVVIANMPEWEQRSWAAQVRNPYIYSTYAADYWVPAYGFQYRWWRGRSVVANMDVLTEMVEIPPSEAIPFVRFGTQISLSLPSNESAAILPGNWYRWDVQTATADDPPKKRTWMRGRARILTEWTVA
jgi:hypothetical protein